MTDARTPVVPFLPWRCPNCGDAKPRTIGHRGRVRYHRCQQCGTPFRSLEHAAEALSAAGLPSPTMTNATPTPGESMTVAELATQLSAPVPAILNAIAGPHPSLLLAGFPRPTRAANGQLVWRRVEVAAHLADPTRRQAAAAAALKGLVGVGIAIGGGPVQIT